MHKFIVNNRIRSDPDPPQLLPNNGPPPTATMATPTTANLVNNKNHLNAALKLKMALPYRLPTNDHLDANNNNNINKSANLSTDCTHASSPDNSRGTQRDAKSTAGDRESTKSTQNLIRMSGYLKKKRNVSKFRNSSSCCLPLLARPSTGAVNSHDNPR